MLLSHVLNSTWSAECAEFASIVIKLVIGNYYPMQTITCLLFKSITSCFEVKLQITNYCVNHYVVIFLNYYKMLVNVQNEGGKKKKRMAEKRNAASRVRTCAGRPHWISSPTP